MNARIERIHAREALDSRGNPTIEVDVAPEGGAGARRGALGSLHRGYMKQWNCASRSGSKAIRV